MARLFLVGFVVFVLYVAIVTVWVPAYGSCGGG
jgi:hypothetical protein